MFTVFLVTALLQTQAPAAPGLALDVAVALTMENRQVVRNARILIDADGVIVEVGRQLDLAIPAGWEWL